MHFTTTYHCHSINIIAIAFYCNINIQHHSINNICHSINMNIQLIILHGIKLLLLIAILTNINIQFIISPLHLNYYSSLPFYQHEHSINNITMAFKLLLLIANINIHLISSLPFYQHEHSINNITIAFKLLLLIAIVYCIKLFLIIAFLLVLTFQLKDSIKRY
jgi:hypothetical protein